MGAITAAISLPLTSPTRRSLTFLTASGRPSSPILKLNSPSAAASPRAPTLRLSAVSSSMSVEAVEKASPAAFLDRREAGFLHFVKYHGLGNDFILVDNRGASEPKISPEQAAKLCDRNFGIGADGVIFALPGINGTDYTMRIFNSDGSEPEVNHIFLNIGFKGYLEI
ncbi:hypothetical protein C1H46_012651 [Malus baccata]|uniref:Diaminopimelate epimerase n=1 Tax=Malus baccata TaxID=106549 RepID=A0A540MSD5_MALBA|nr:hypothetical protein C1H46_012651 [Malus baccata]